jgi:hypothetical protein
MATNSNFKVLTAQSVGTAPVQIGGYSVGGGVQATIFNLSIANTTAPSLSSYIPTASVYIYDGSSTNTYIIKSAPVPYASTLVVVGVDQKIALTNGYQIYVYSNTASAVDVICSIAELS